MKPPPGYRLLRKGDIVRLGDLRYDLHYCVWDWMIDQHLTGEIYAARMKPMARKAMSCRGCKNKFIKFKECGGCKQFSKWEKK